MRTDKTAIALAVLAVAVVVATAAPAVSAQAKDPAGPNPRIQHGPQMQDPGSAVPNRISGRIQSVARDQVTLTDGTQLILPPGLPMQRDQLRPGVTIKASYAATAGHKVATSIELEPTR